MTKKGIILVYTFLMISLFSQLQTPALAVNTTVSVNPASVVVRETDIFTVNVTVVDVSRLYAWEFKLFWKKSIINCTEATIQTPDIWPLNQTFAVGPGIENNYNATHARYWKGFTALYPAPMFNGSMTLVIFTFKALKTGSTELKLKDVILATFRTGIPIPRLVFDGTVTVPLYMRSDEHMINGATMHQLQLTQTETSNVTSRFITDPENEAVCYWGIRIWRRSSGGTETEISSGYPVAVVYRTGSGMGMQSTTWVTPASNLTQTDALVVRVYYKFFDFSSYTQSSEFITQQLNATTLTSQTWTVYYYTQRAYSSATHKTTMYYYWDGGYDSHIENIDYN